MKKAVAAILVLLLLVPFGIIAHAGDLPTIPLTSVKTRLAGDANSDRFVDLRDATSISRFLVGGYNVTIDEDAANVNGDDRVDLKDVAVLRRYLVGGWNVELI